MKALRRIVICGWLALGLMPDGVGDVEGGIYRTKESCQQAIRPEGPLVLSANPSLTWRCYELHFKD